MNKVQKDKIARNAASTWCRCFKCDGIIRETHDECDKEKLLTCHQWYHGYRTALLALGDYERQMIDNACEFLDGSLYDYVEMKHPNVDTFLDIKDDKLIEDFKKAMED